MRAGSEGFVIGLSGWGHAVLALCETRLRRHRRVIETKPAFQSHVLAISELYVALTEHSRTGDSELIEFSAEPEAWRQFGGLGGQAITLKPDGFVRLGVGDIEVLAFLEQDMNTESLPTIARKLGVYVSYWRSGQEQRHFGVFPKVWWLAPSTRRLEGIHQAISRLPLEARALFAVCLSTDATTTLTQGGAS